MVNIRNLSSFVSSLKLPFSPLAAFFSLSLYLRRLVLVLVLLFAGPSTVPSSKLHPAMAAIWEELAGE
jgi:hypothetical protein